MLFFYFLSLYTIRGTRTKKFTDDTIQIMLD